MWCGKTELNPSSDRESHSATREVCPQDIMGPQGLSSAMLNQLIKQVADAWLSVWLAACRLACLRCTVRLTGCLAGLPAG